MLTTPESTNPRRTRKQTSAKATSQIAVYCAVNRERLTGRTLRDIGGEIRKHLNGTVISDRAIVLACEAAGVVVARKTREPSSHANRRNTTRALAAVLVRLASAVEASIGANPGSLLSQEDRELLSKIRGGHSIEKD